MEAKPLRATPEGESDMGFYNACPPQKERQLLTLMVARAMHTPEDGYARVLQVMWDQSMDFLGQPTAINRRLADTQSVSSSRSSDQFSTDRARARKNVRRYAR